MFRYASVILLASSAITYGQGVERVSVSTGGTQANGPSRRPSISGDGRYVAFVSEATNLVSGDTNGAPDVFVRDRLTGQTSRASVSSSGVQGNGGSYHAPRISADGRYVAFQSWVSNLVAGDDVGPGCWDGCSDVFVHDRQTLQTTRVSVTSSGTPGNGHSGVPLDNLYGDDIRSTIAISADGRFVTFSTHAENLPGGFGIVVHDRHTGITSQVDNYGSFPCAPGNNPSISADGTQIAFWADGGCDINRLPDVFVSNRSFPWWSTNISYPFGGGGNSAISGNGRFVGSLTLQSPSQIVLYDRDPEGDGTFIISGPNPSIIVSVASTGIQGNQHSDFPSLSFDGRYVAFQSNATNLVPSDTNTSYDVFVHDRETGRTSLVSLSSDGAHGNSASVHPSLSANGHVVAFSSYASNLVPGDTNGKSDVFVTGSGVQVDECTEYRGRIVFPNGAPIRNAHIYAYYIDGGVLHRLEDGEEIVTADDGTYTTPDAFCLRDQGVEPYASMQLGVLAEIRYDDPGLKAAAEVAGMPYDGEVIVNYPSNDPFAPISKAFTGQETIVVPYPTILQPGLWGGVNARSLDILGRYLRCDPGARCFGVPNGVPKAEWKLPAFLTFTMPSGNYSLQNNDDVAWGYNNSMPLSTRHHDENIEKLDNFMEDRVRATLLSMVLQPGSVTALPINICAHSMGATITRGWMHDHHLPLVERYVSFDGVHGGTGYKFLSANLLVGGFSEPLVNGSNPIPYGSPIIQGWNYLHKVDGVASLLMSSSMEDTVNPNCSAFGVGRTMLGPLSVLALIPNGHRERFIAGWEWHTPYDHSLIHDAPDTVFAAAKYLAYGEAPVGATRSVPASECIDEPPDAQAVGNGVPGTYSVRMDADSMQTVNQPVFLDANGMLSLAVILEGTDATVALLGPLGQSLTPDDVETYDVEGVGLSNSTYKAPPIGLSILRLVGGSNGGRATITLEFSNQRKLAVGLPDQTVEAGNLLQIVAEIRNSTDQVIVGEGGMVRLSVERSDFSRFDLTLFDDGLHGDGSANDGSYGNSFSDTALGGRYFVNAHATAEFQNETIERTACAMFVVNSSPASLINIANERIIDEDSDSKSDFLDLDIDVEVVVTKSYLLKAVLSDNNGEQVAEVHQVFDGIGAASQTVTLRLAAADLVGHGTPGPWTLGSIELFDDEQILLVDTLPDYQTGAYALTQFETPPAPMVLQAVPDHGSLLGETEIILQGQHFEHISELLWNGQPVSDFMILEPIPKPDSWCLL